MKKRYIPILLLLFSITLIGNGTDAENAEAKDNFVARLFDISSLIQLELPKVPVFGWDIENKESHYFIADDLLSIDEVIDLIYNETGTNNWGGNEKSYIAPAGGNKLRVFNNPVIVEQVSELLASLRPKHATYKLSIALYKLPTEKASEIAERPIKGFAEENARIASEGYASLFCTTTRIIPDHTAVIADVHKQKYIAEYSARLATMAVGYDTITETFTFGRAFILKAREMENKVSLYLKMDSWELQNIEKIDLTFGPIEKPELLNYFFEDNIVFGDVDTERITYISGGNHYMLMVGLSNVQ